MTDEMKPVRCGCGGPTKIDYICIETYSHEHDCPVVEPVYRVFCKQCGISTPCAYPTEADAIEAWNRAMSGNLQECAENARCSERTAKVDWINGEPFCPMCGDRLEWE